MNDGRAQLDRLIRTLHARPLDRRRLVLGAGALGLAGTAFGAGVLRAAAQDASPVAATGEPIRSQTREEFNAQLVEDLGFTEAATPGGTFLDSSVSDIQTLMPFLAEEQNSLGIAGMIFDTLTGGDPRTGQPAPNGLADSWEIAPDQKTYTFYLNKNATWHDGRPVTAEDVQFSFDALADEATGSVYTGAFLDTVASWRIIDDYTYEMVAKEPTIDFLYNLTAFIVPKHVWENVPRDQWRNDPGATGQDPARVVGSGPFKFQEWRPGESITLVKNENYYDKVPSIDEYIMRIWPDQQAVVNALLNGEIDVAALEPADVAAIEGTPGIAIATYPTRSFTYIVLNQNTEMTSLFQDRPVRQALMYALDRESIVNDILLGYGEVARGTQPLISYAYAPEEITTNYTFDPEQAKQLLGEAGWSDTDGDGVVDKDGQPLRFEFLYSSGSPTTEQVVAYIQDAWKAIGVEITPRALEFPALIEATTGDQPWDAFLIGFAWDATFIQDAMFGCAQYKVGFNDMKYCNPKLDEINAQAKREFDEAKRRDLLIQASNIVNDDLPVLILWFREANVAYSDKLQNFKPGPWGVPLNYVWIRQ